MVLSNKGEALVCAFHFFFFFLSFIFSFLIVGYRN